MAGVRRVRLIWVRASDGSAWAESVWDEESIDEHEEGWKAEVTRVRAMCAENAYDFRIQRVKVPSVDALFAVPEVEAVQTDD